MVHDRLEDVDRIQAAELLRAGRTALASGQHERAHDLWRQAAALHPQNEAVWLSLLQVVKNKDDRRVCLENIITINPRNEQAMRQLRALALFDNNSSPDNPIDSPAENQPPHPLLRGALLVMRVLVTVAVLLLIVALAIAAGVLLSSI